MCESIFLDNFGALSALSTAGSAQNPNDGNIRLKNNSNARLRLAEYDLILEQAQLQLAKLAVDWFHVSLVELGAGIKYF